MARIRSAGNASTFCRPAESPALCASEAAGGGAAGGGDSRVEAGAAAAAAKVE